MMTCPECGHEFSGDLHDLGCPRCHETFEVEVGDRLATFAARMFRTSIDPMADAFANEPDREYTGGEVARILREFSVRAEGDLRERFGLEAEVEVGRPE